MISLSHPNDGLSNSTHLYHERQLILSAERPCGHADGRVTFTLVELPGQEAAVELKYQLLNPAPNFVEVVEEARSVVLAGGTMSPVRPSLITVSIQSRWSAYSRSALVTDFGRDQSAFL